MNYFQLYLSPANIILHNYSKIKQIKPETKVLPTTLSLSFQRPHPEKAPCLPEWRSPGEKYMERCFLKSAQVLLVPQAYEGLLQGHQQGNCNKQICID